MRSMKISVRAAGLRANWSLYSPAYCVQRQDPAPTLSPSCGRAVRQAGPSHGVRWSSRVSWGSAVSTPGAGIYPPASVTLVAARLIGQAPAESKADKSKDADKKKDEKPAPAGKINVIAIADLDMIGEQFFEMRRRKVEDLEFDNVPFVLNCVDVLAGDESFVGLRAKRPIHRRLEKIEQTTKIFNQQLAQKTKEAEDEASDQMLKAQQAFDKEVDAVKNRAEWDERTKEQISSRRLQHLIAQRRRRRSEAGHRRQKTRRDPRGEGGIRT